MKNKIKIIKIGNVKIDKIAALAPMAGITNIGFRELMKEYGASYLETEMISSNALCYGDKKTINMLKISSQEHPIGIQLFGANPTILAKAAYLALKYSPDIIDINMGCPVKKVTNNNSGSALMKNPKLVKDIIREVVKTVNIPVVVKIRSGWDKDNINAVDIAKIAEDNGASGVIIHGRTKQQMYSFKASNDIIREVKKAVKIPVIGNGDIIDVKSALNMYKETNCDLIMIGRGCLGNPWIFKNIKAYLEIGTELDKPSLKEIISVMRYQINIMLKYEPEKVVIREARKHIGWYIRGFKNAAIIRGKIPMINDISDLNFILNEYIKLD